MYEDFQCSTIVLTITVKFYISDETKTPINLHKGSQFDFWDDFQRLYFVEIFAADLQHFIISRFCAACLRCNFDRKSHPYLKSNNFDFSFADVSRRNRLLKLKDRISHNKIMSYNFFLIESKCSLSWGKKRTKTAKKGIQQTVVTLLFSFREFSGR